MKTPQKTETAAPFLPNRLTLPALRQAAESCEGCHLYKHATQTVFGAGPKNADVMIVGEIPGEKEDEEGEPFVGPAGMFLRKTIEEVGIDISAVYLTNVVKHFKFVISGKRKLHRSPVATEIKACKPWLEAELKVVHPKVILCLGAIAAKAIVSNDFKITQQHGKWFTTQEHFTAIATFHPSTILRAPDEQARHQMKKYFRNDLKKIALFLAKQY